MAKTHAYIQVVGLICLVAFWAVPADAVTLSIGKASSVEGNSVIVPVQLDVGSDLPPAALAFNIDYGDAPFTITGVSAGASARLADKSTSFEPTARGARILVGGVNENSLSNGQLVRITFEPATPFKKLDEYELSGANGSAAAVDATRVPVDFVAGKLNVTDASAPVLGVGTLFGLALICAALFLSRKKLSKFIAVFMAMLLLPVTTLALIAGDVNISGEVNNKDLDEVAHDILGRGSSHDTDINADDVTDAVDYQILVRALLGDDIDADEDGLSDPAELILGTDVNDPDSDNDSANDGFEVFTGRTSPTDPDSDDDGIGDGLEIKPNVLFIAVDDLNDFVTFMDNGHAQTLTPNLSRLADRGIVFRRAYCQAPACNPSRASLLTGRLPHNSGVYLNSQDWRVGTDFAAGGIKTLPQQMTASGHISMGSGKIFHGSKMHRESWDIFFPDSTTSQKPPNGSLSLQTLFGPHGNFTGGITDPEENMSDHKVATWVSEQLAKQHDKPFFLACGIYRPHLPFHAPQKYFDLFPPDSVQLPELLPLLGGETPADAALRDLDDVPAMGKSMRKKYDQVLNDTPQWKTALRCYLASIAFADAQIGRVLDALDASPYRDNTIIVLWGDHGWSLGQKGDWKKFHVWEQVARVPFLVAGPGIEGGRVSNELVGLIDLYPTLLDLTGGLPAGHKLDGRSLRPLLVDPDAPEWNYPAFTIQKNSNTTAGASVRTEQWRYILYADGGEELYNHNTQSPDYDPNEWHNLAPTADASLLSELRALLPTEAAFDPPL